MEHSTGMEFLCKLGEGSYGSVHKVRLVPTGEVVAIKVVRLSDDDEGLNSTTLRELTLLQTLDHPNIIKYGPHLAQIT
jgi:serine/threonine protein kinase